MYNSAVLAGTKAENRTDAEVRNVSPACINTFVGGGSILSKQLSNFQML